MNILYLANQYSMDRLVTIGEGLLVRIVNATTNAASLYDFADMFNLPYLKANAGTRFRASARRQTIRPFRRTR
jgi:hypothetical protein